MKRLAVVAAHPDDEVLSAGALLLKAEEMGVQLHILWMTEGARSASPEAAQRWGEAGTVAERLGADHQSLGLAEGTFDRSQLTPKIEKILKSLSPDVVVWPFGGGAEQHQDHCAVHEALLNISKRWDYASCSWVAGRPPRFNDPLFRPNLYLTFDAASLRDLQRLMELYVSERHKDFADPDFLETQAKAWRAEGQTGTPFAEPYMLVKGVPPAELFRTRRIALGWVRDVLEGLDLDSHALVMNHIRQLRVEVGRMASSRTARVCRLDVPTAGAEVHVFYFTAPDGQIVLLSAHRGPGFRPAQAVAVKRRREWLARGAGGR